MREDGSDEVPNGRKACDQRKNCEHPAHIRISPVILVRRILAEVEQRYAAASGKILVPFVFCYSPALLLVLPEWAGVLAYGTDLRG